MGLWGWVVLSFAEEEDLEMGMELDGRGERGGDVVMGDGEGEKEEGEGLFEECDDDGDGGVDEEMREVGVWE